MWLYSSACFRASCIHRQLLRKHRPHAATILRAASPLSPSEWNHERERRWRKIYVRKRWFDRSLIRIFVGKSGALAPVSAKPKKRAVVESRGGERKGGSYVGKGDKNATGGRRSEREREREGVDIKAVLRHWQTARYYIRCFLCIEKAFSSPLLHFSRPF